jgi:hypothetical protein
MRRLRDKLKSKSRNGSESHPKRQPVPQPSVDDNTTALSSQAKAKANIDVSTPYRYEESLIPRWPLPRAHESFKLQSPPPPLQTITSEPVAQVRSNPSYDERPSTQEYHLPLRTSTPALKEASSSTTDPDLWRRAYKVLQERESQLVESYERLICPDGGEFDTEERMKQAIQTKLERRESRHFIFKLADKSIKVREWGDSIAKLMIWSEGIVSTAISAQPYAALAWTGVSIFLPVGSNGQRHGFSSLTDP